MAASPYQVLGVTYWISFTASGYIQRDTIAGIRSAATSAPERAEGLGAPSPKVSSP